MSGIHEHLADSEALSLVEAFTKGQGGNAAQVTFNVGQGGTSGFPICNVDVPRAQSRTWLVTLANMRSGAVPAIPVGQHGIDNFIGNAFQEQGTYANGAPGGGTSPLKVQFQWGTGEMIDTCLVDYPWGGGTYQVSGSSVRVTIPPTDPFITATNVVPPRVGGFITARENGSVSPALRVPTYTTFTQSIPSGASGRSWDVPKRAWGYQVVSNETVMNVTGLQIYPDNSIVQIDFNAADFRAPAQLSSREFFRLNAATTIVRIINGDAASRTAGLVFAIDLG